MIILIYVKSIRENGDNVIDGVACLPVLRAWLPRDRIVCVDRATAIDHK